MSEITLLAEVTAFLRQPHGQFIAGQREAGRGAPFAVINPATGRAIAEVTAADSDQADRAMESARQAFSQWREMPTLARGALLLKLADTLAEHREALAQLESLCSGKTITLARMLELDQSVAFLRYFAGWAGKVTGETLDVSLPSMAGEKYTAFTRRQPLGGGGWHRAVELLHHDCHLEAGGGPGLRLHHRPQAERIYAPDAAARGGAGKSGGYPGWGD